MIVSALRDCSLQSSGDIVDPDEERDQGRATLQRTDATRYGALNAGIYVAVAGHPSFGERPAEELPEERPGRIRVDDLISK